MRRPAGQREPEPGSAAFAREIADLAAAPLVEGIVAGAVPPAAPPIDRIALPNHDEAARQRFVSTLRKRIMVDMAGRMREVYRPDLEAPLVFDVPHNIVLREGRRGVPDDLKLTAKLVPAATVSEEALCRWIAERVPHYAVPRYIEFRETMPKNPQGRVLKYQLRDEGKTAATWDQETSGITVAKR